MLDTVRFGLDKIWPIGDGGKCSAMVFLFWFDLQC